MSQDKREDDGVVTSAPASNMGSLLTDLLSQAKKDVASERQQLEQQLQAREDEQRSAELREEARRRETMLQKLNEETQARNAALANAKKDRSEEGKRTAFSTARHNRAELRDAAEAAETRPAAPTVAPSRRGLPPWLLAALVLVGLGLGVGGAFALTPTPKVNLPDVTAAAHATIAATVTAAKAEGKVAEALEQANDRLAELERRMDEALASQTALAEKLGETQQALEETQEELARAQEARPAAPRPPRTTRPPAGPTVPNIDTGVFSNPRR